MRIDGLEAWVGRRQHHPARGSGRSRKSAEQSKQGWVVPGAWAGQGTVPGSPSGRAHRRAPHRVHPQGSRGGFQHTVSISGCLSLRLFLQSSLPVSQEVSLIPFPREAV